MNFGMKEALQPLVERAEAALSYLANIADEQARTNELLEQLVKQGEPVLEYKVEGEIDKAALQQALERPVRTARRKT